MAEKKPLIIYHAGRHGIDGIRKNTFASIERALKESARAIECDVCLDRENRICIGHRSRPPKNAPTLKEVLDYIGGRALLNLDIKNPEAKEPVVRVLKEALSSGIWKPEQIVPSSFHHETVIYIKKHVPNLHVGIINDGLLRIPVLSHLYHTWKIDGVHLEWENILMDIEDGFQFRDVAQKLDMYIWVWTINTKKAYEQAVAYGVDGIFTDKPELFF